MSRGDDLRVAIVGAATLKGKELKELLSDRSFPAGDVRLLDDDESLGQLDLVGDEATFIQSVRPEHFQDVDVAFFAADESFTRRHWKLARDAGCKVVDLSYALEDEAGAQLRAPWLEEELGRAAPVAGDVAVVAHPAAVVLGIILHRARRLAALRTAVVTAFEPASEHGRRGVDELHEQTVKLLSFQQVPREIFDSQVAFNLLARYGEQSLPTLESVERRIAAHLRRIGGERLPVPSLMLLQAPIFHGHAFSIYIELEPPVATGDLAQALAGEHVSIARLAEESPSTVSVAGQEQMVIAVRRDAQHENGFWLWAAADNLKLTALSALECAAAWAGSGKAGSRERLQ